jgi:hypothetical protein
MGCCFSATADNQSLLGPDIIYELKPYRYDDIYGHCYISPDISRYIRNKAIGLNEENTKLFMASFPQLHYQVGGMELTRERFYRGVNNIRFVLDDMGRCKLVLFG